MKTLRLGERHTSNPKLFSQGASAHTRSVFGEEELCSSPSCPICPAGTPRQEFPGCPLNPRLVPAGKAGPAAPCAEETGRGGWGHPELRGRRHVGVYAPVLVGLCGCEHIPAPPGEQQDARHRSSWVLLPCTRGGCPPGGARGTASKQGAGPCSSVSWVMNEAAARSAGAKQGAFTRHTADKRHKCARPAAGEAGQGAWGCLRPQRAQQPPGCAEGEAGAGHSPRGQFFTGQGWLKRRRAEHQTAHRWERSGEVVFFWFWSVFIVASAFRPRRNKNTS